MHHHNNRFYREGECHHLYIKAQEGMVLFYRADDYLFLYTLFGTLVWRHQLEVEMFCIMFNHIHACLYAQSEESFIAFCRDLSSIFTKGYNKEFNRKGKLLMSCGYASKSSGKKQRSCLIYIANNPVAGRLVDRAIDYKWNLLAYFVSNHPFSERLVKRNCRFAMRQSLKLADWCFKEGKYLNYTLLAQLFQRLSSKERNQMIDYIIVKYFFVDKHRLINHFGGIEKAVMAIDSSAGSEYDLYEPWEDYSVYLSMIRITMDSCIDYKQFRFHEMSRENLRILRRRLSSIKGATDMHIARFLHLECDI